MPGAGASRTTNRELLKHLGAVVLLRVLALCGTPKGRHRARIALNRYRNLLLGNLPKT